jgi:hypothetical protein
LCSCRVSVPVASFTLTAAIVTANGSVPQLDQILWQCPYLTGEVSSLCPMCKKETENTAHFILQCASLQKVRTPFMDTILSYLETNENLTPYVTDLLEDQNMLQLLIDCTKFNFVPLKERSYLETLSRQMRSRLKIIGKLNFKQNCYF